MLPTFRTLYRISREQLVASPRAEVFAFFANAANLEQLAPAFLHIRVLTPMPIDMGIGKRIDYAIALFGVPMRWRHTHDFESQGLHGLIRYRVEYALPLGPLAKLAQALLVERTLMSIFEYRREAASHIFGQGQRMRPMGSAAWEHSV